MPDEQRGEAVLFRIRDRLIELASRKRLSCEQGVRLGGVPMTESELEDILALEAASDCMQFLISFIQQLRLEKPDLTRRDVPNWFVKICFQARAGYETKAGGASDDGKQGQSSLAGLD